MAYEPMFKQNPSVAETGCEKAGLDGVVCTCQRDGQHFVCGVVRIDRRGAGDKFVTEFHAGIDADGGQHHIGERTTGMGEAQHDKLRPTYIQRRFQRH